MYCSRINKRLIIVICDIAYNLIACKKLRLTEVRDYSETSMHFEIMYIYGYMLCRYLSGSTFQYDLTKRIFCLIMRDAEYFLRFYL